MILRCVIPMMLVAAVAAATPIQTFPNQSLQCGRPGGALAYATVADHADLHAAEFTVEAWFRADPSQTLSPYPIVLTKPNNNRMNGDCTFGFVIERSTGRLSFRVSTTAGTFNATGAANLLDGAWHHVAGVRGSMQTQLFVDGVLAGSAAVTGGSGYSTDPLTIGAASFPGYEGNGFVGQIDEVRFWNRTRASFDIATDRGLVYNAKPGLVAAWHFDRWYPNDFGGSRFLDSVAERVAATNGVATLTGSAPALSRGTNLHLADVLCQADYTGPRRTLGAVRLSGHRDLVYRQATGANNPGNGRLEVIGFGPGPRVLGGIDLPLETPVVRMAARDTLVHCVKTVGTSQRLFTVRVSDPMQPVVQGDSVDVAANVKLVRDSGNGNLLVAAGTRAGSNILSIVNVTNPYAPVLDVANDVGETSSMGAVLDVAKRGQYLYATFSDGTLRMFRYDIFTFNGIQIRTLNPVGTPFGIAGAPRLAIHGATMYVAGADGMVRMFDLTTPTSPVQFGTAGLTFVHATELQVLDPTRVVVSGPNGVHVVLVSNPQAIGTVASYCADLSGAGGPAVSIGGDLLGLTAGLGGYSQLVPTGALGVEEPEIEAPIATLVAGPNPSRGTVWFRLPSDPGVGARLEIYDTSGRRVRALTPDAAASGRVAWDAADDAGVPVRPGLYFARVHAGGAEWRARVTIVR